MPSEKEIKAADRELAAMSIHDLHNDLRRRLLAERVLVAAKKEQEVEVRVREIADWIERDRREPDKLLCHVASLRRVALRRELASSRLSAAEKEREGEGGAIHVDVCPDCGATDSGHMMDPPPHCPHQRECFVPVRYVPAGREGDIIEKLRELLSRAMDGLECDAESERRAIWHEVADALDALNDLQEQSTPKEEA